MSVKDSFGDDIMIETTDTDKSNIWLDVNSSSFSVLTLSLSLGVG